MSFTIHSNAQDETLKVKRGLGVGIFSGVHFPTNQNRVLGELYSFGLFGEARYNKNGFGISFGFLGKNNYPKSLDFYLTQSNNNYSLTKLSGMTLSLDYSRELLELNPFFVEGLLSVGYSNMDYHFDQIGSIGVNSLLISPGLLFRFLIYDSGSGAMFTMFKIQYNIVDLSLKKVNVSKNITGNYLSLTLCLGLSAH